MDFSSKKMSLTEIDSRFDNIEKMMTEITKSKLVIADKEYSLSEWITTSDYVKNNRLAIARVHNWITRGVIPKDCIVIIPELNHLKLIKNQSYETRATK
ncbi:hypothetical protein [Dyadobacter frigoris]|uniref:Uncharacterized protein n=1 Tax=Dyadobacter frigoris TaxID=2576211 RepID=A0A4U6DCI4_9BACT|nr:hypothetical protein [Dyadobacter frigoris]TKT93978.1 hypothetical protein FDK13_01840 [Dyadobacter frigoris]